MRTCDTHSWVHHRLLFLFLLLLLLFVIYVVEGVSLMRIVYKKCMRMRDEVMGSTQAHFKLTISLGKRRCSLSSIQPNRELCHGMHILWQTIE